MVHGKSQSGICVLLGLLLVALLACRTPAVPIIAEPKAEGIVPSETLDIDIYLDGSGSIRNFLATPATVDGGTSQTNYVADLLNKGESVLSNAPGKVGWKDVHVRSWRFGTGQPAPLGADGGLAEMGRDTTNFHGDTKIEVAIQHQAPSSGSDPRPELKIVLTDLYQTDGLIESPGDALARKYLKNDIDAVGVIAVRSPFTGPVEDLPGTQRGGSLPHAADSMPFYLIFAGAAGDVRHAMEVLVAGTRLDEAMKKGRADQFWFSRAPEHRGEEKMKFSGATYSTVKENYQDWRIQLISLSKGNLKATWSDTRPGIASRANGAEEIVPSISIVGTDGTFKDGADPEAAQPCKGGELLCETIDRSKLRDGTTYMFRFDRLQPSVPDPLTPNSHVLTKWNIELADAREISAKGQKAEFPQVKGLPGHPGMTPDLSKFLLALQGQMYHTPVRITSYFLYVQAD